MPELNVTPGKWNLQQMYLAMERFRGDIGLADDIRAMAAAGLMYRALKAAKAEADAFCGKGCSCTTYGYCQRCQDLMKETKRLRDVAIAAAEE